MWEDLLEDRTGVVAEGDGSLELYWSAHDFAPGSNGGILPVR